MVGTVHLRRPRRPAQSRRVGIAPGEGFRNAYASLRFGDAVARHPYLGGKGRDERTTRVLPGRFARPPAWNKHRPKRLPTIFFNSRPGLLCLILTP
jgi:hypothetical protein